MPTKLELLGAGVMAKRDRRSDRKVIDRRLKEGRGHCYRGHRLATFQTVEMPLRFDADMPDDDVNRIRLWERPPVNLLFTEILERVFETIPYSFVHFDNNS